MTSFVFAPEAAANLPDIWDYIAAQDGTRKADHVVNRLMRECQKLSQKPTLGRVREELLDSRHRFWRSWNYLIAYRWQSKPLQNIAIVHAARDLDEFFR